LNGGGFLAMLSSFFGYRKCSVKKDERKIHSRKMRERFGPRKMRERKAQVVKVWHNIGKRPPAIRGKSALE
jgi:hypothetical protein